MLVDFIEHHPFVLVLMALGLFALDVIYDCWAARRNIQMKSKQAIKMREHFIDQMLDR